MYLCIVQKQIESVLVLGKMAIKMLQTLKYVYPLYCTAESILLEEGTPHKNNLPLKTVTNDNIVNISTAIYEVMNWSQFFWLCLTTTYWSIFFLCPGSADQFWSNWLQFAD